MSDQFAPARSIKEQLIAGMELPQYSSRHYRWSDTVDIKIEFEIEWDFIALHGEQAYSESLEAVLATAITLTGDHNNVQAATCMDYN
ncbi:Glycylpeptide N-tetradecanoyltransferase [Pestalotiopsis sp. IQ-011]